MADVGRVVHCAVARKALCCACIWRDFIVSHYQPSAVSGNLLKMVLAILQ